MDGGYGHCKRSDRLAGDIDIWVDVWMDLIEGNTGMWMHE